MAGLQLIKNPSIGTYITIAIVLTAGTAFLMWLGEEITANGVGNGISIIIFAGIVAGIPKAVNQIYAQHFEDAENSFSYALLLCFLFLLAIVAIVVGVVFIQQALRKIPIQYAKRIGWTHNIRWWNLHICR